MSLIEEPDTERFIYQTEIRGMAESFVRQEQLTEVKDFLYNPAWTLEKS